MIQIQSVTMSLICLAQALATEAAQSSEARQKGSCEGANTNQTQIMDASAQHQQ
jgi:hypothetical protein